MTLKRMVPIVLVVGGIAIGVAVTLVSFLAGEKQWDRETAISAAKYDGEKLLEELADVPLAKPVGYLEMKIGPLRQDLSTGDEAWVRWEQQWSTGGGFAGVVTWHREHLAGTGWTQREGLTKESARFTRGQWEIVLEPRESPETPSEKGFVRRLEWNRVFPLNR